MRDFLYRRIVARILQINDTPESIALGAAVGMFIAMTPTVGIQMILMIAVGTFVRANRLAGVVMVYISNPLTMIPIYWADYWVGALVMGKEIMAREEFERVFRAFLDQMDTGFWHAMGHIAEVLGWDVALPMTLGGSLVGLVLAIPTYPITLRMVRGHQRRKAHRKALQQLRAESRSTVGDSSDVEETSARSSEDISVLPKNE